MRKGTHKRKRSVVLELLQLEDRLSPSVMEGFPYVFTVQATYVSGSS
jgi:hypothetical protein